MEIIKKAIPAKETHILSKELIIDRLSFYFTPYYSIKKEEAAELNLFFCDNYSKLIKSSISFFFMRPISLSTASSVETSSKRTA